MASMEDGDVGAPRFPIGDQPRTRARRRRSNQGSSRWSSGGCPAEYRRRDRRCSSVDLEPLEDRPGNTQRHPQRHDLQRAEPSILTAEEEADRAQTIALEQGVEVPNLGNFVTLHFPPDTDTRVVAEELGRLPQVERAVAVPTAIPPQTPLTEPLLGTS